jgi:hypothetical protein
MIGRAALAAVGIWAGLVASPYKSSCVSATNGPFEIGHIINRDSVVVGESHVPFTDMYIVKSEPLLVLMNRAGEHILISYNNIGLDGGFACLDEAGERVAPNPEIIKFPVERLFIVLRKVNSIQYSECPFFLAEVAKKPFLPMRGGISNQVAHFKALDRGAAGVFHDYRKAKLVSLRHLDLVRLDKDVASNLGFTYFPRDDIGFVSGTNCIPGQFQRTPNERSSDYGQQSLQHRDKKQPSGGIGAAFLGLKIAGSIILFVIYLWGVTETVHRVWTAASDAEFGAKPVNQTRVKTLYGAGIFLLFGGSLAALPLLAFLAWWIG